MFYAARQRNRQDPGDIAGFGKIMSLCSFVTD